MARDRASRPEAAPLRLFVAVDVPDAQRTAVERAIEPLRERFPTGKWVPSENWHVTVKFLGRTYPRLVGWVVDQCREAAAGIRPFRVAVGGLGAFPRPTRARVLWAGLQDPDRSLQALAATLEKRLAREFPTEKRPFTAHLTVARFDPPIPLDGATALEATRIEAKPFRVGEVVLYRSHLSPRGARYEPLERFSLRG